MSNKKIELDNFFLERLEAAIAATKKSKKQFALDLSISPSHITKILKGETGISRQLYDSICRVHGISRDFLEQGVGEVFIAEPETEYHGKKSGGKMTVDDVAALLRNAGYAEEDVEAFEAFTQLPKRKKRIRLGQMLEDLDEIKDEEQPKGDRR